jgi:heat shock protein HtpX
MASIATLKINSYFFMGITVLLLVILLAIAWWATAIPIIFWIFLGVIFIIFQIVISSAVVKWATKTRILKKGENPFLEKTVKKLAKKAGLPMPKVGIVESHTPNAFVFGLTKSGSTLSVHRGLLEQLNTDEIEAVIGHELGHIKNRDCMYMTILSVIPILSFMVARIVLYSRGRRGAGPVIIAGLVGLLVFAITFLLIKRLSRIREFYADAYSGFLTKNPHSLASALTKISWGLSLAPSDAKGDMAARSFYIGDVENSRMEMANIQKNANKYDLDGDGVLDENELEKAMAEEAKHGGGRSFSGLLSTHPPTFKRILALKEMEKEMKKGKVRADNVYEKVEF